METYILVNADGNLLSTYTGAYPLSQIDGACVRVYSVSDLGGRRINENFFCVISGKLALRANTVVTGHWDDLTGFSVVEVTS